MTRTIEERMLDGDADPGMYPEVAERVFGWREQEYQRDMERMREQEEDYRRMEAEHYEELWWAEWLDPKSGPFR